MVSKFTIGQRVEMFGIGDWNGTPLDDRTVLGLIRARFRGIVVRQQDKTTVSVEVDGDELGVLQFLPDELAVLDNTSGDSVE